MWWALARPTSHSPNSTGAHRCGGRRHRLTDVMEKPETGKRLIEDAAGIADVLSMKRAFAVNGIRSLGLPLVVAVIAASLAAQVVTPMELSDPKTQRLQQRYYKTLGAIGSEVEAHKFPYPFYFSRVLDVDQSKMQAQDQRSIRFDFYKNQTVLEITGNYYTAYSAEEMEPYKR